MTVTAWPSSRRLATSPPHDSAMSLGCGATKTCVICPQPNWARPTAMRWVPPMDWPAYPLARAYRPGMATPWAEAWANATARAWATRSARVSATGWATGWVAGLAGRRGRTAAQIRRSGRRRPRSAPPRCAKPGRRQRWAPRATAEASYRWAQSCGPIMQAQAPLRGERLARERVGSLVVA
jgi:hypothetical protein